MHVKVDLCGKDVAKDGSGSYVISTAAVVRLRGNVGREHSNFHKEYLQLKNTAIACRRGCLQFTFSLLVL